MDSHGNDVVSINNIRNHLVSVNVHVFIDVWYSEVIMMTCKVVTNL